MAKNTIADLDTTSANNTDVMGQSTAGTALANTIDSIVQKFLGLVARFYADIGGLGTVGGTANAITLTSLSTYQALETGLIIAFKAGADVTTASTLNVDALGAKALRRNGDTATQSGDIVSGGIYTVVYDAAANSAAGGWILPSGTASGGGGGATAATAAEVWAGTATSTFLTPAILQASLVEQALVDGSTVTVDFAAGINFKLDTIGGNRTLAFGTITSAIIGRSGYIRVVQDTTGTRTLNMSSSTIISANGVDLVLSTAANAEDWIFYTIKSTSKVAMSMGRAYS